MEGEYGVCKGSDETGHSLIRLEPPPSRVRREKSPVLPGVIRLICHSRSEAIGTAELYRAVLSLAIETARIVRKL
jgi:hypothetical protein